MGTLGELFSLLGSLQCSLKKLLFRTQGSHLPCSYMLTTTLNSCCFSTIYFSGQRKRRQKCGHRLCSSATFSILVYPRHPPSPLCFEMNCCAGPSKKSSLTKTNGLVPCCSPGVGLAWLGGALPGEEQAGWRRCATTPLSQRLLPVPL